MLSKEEYEDICKNLMIPAYQDKEHEDMEWRLYSEGELLVELSLAIREVGESK